MLRFKEKSNFTYKDLIDLNDKEKAYKSPLSVICHIDLNAFFAQCEQLRLGLSDKDPVVCVQWDTLIAVSYAARDYGITRMDRLAQAKLKCPNLIPAHTAVFQKGNPSWKYVDYVPSPINHKISLDPYRREGKKVLNLFRNECDLVEKASVDESFMDFGRLVFKRILNLFPNLLNEMKDINDNLPIIDNLPNNLNFKGYIIKKDNNFEKKSCIANNDDDDDDKFQINDWDDLVILIGSIICFELRKKIESSIGFKTSGGVGRVKTIAKLASGFQKPDQQTIVRNDSIPIFLKHFKLTDFWSLGGKTGNWIYESIGNETSISNIHDNYKSPKELAKILNNNHDLAEKIYLMIRGEYSTPLKDTEIFKSMTSNKNFRSNSVSKKEHLIPWIKVFVGELILRIQDTDEEYNTILRPTKLTLSLLNSSGIRHSKQCTLTQSPKDYELLRQLYYTTSLDLLKKLEDLWNSSSNNQKMFPVLNACLTVSTFVDLSNINTLDDLIPNVKKRKIDNSKHSNNEETLINNKLNRHNCTKIEEKKISKILNIKNTLLCNVCNEEINQKDWQIHQDYHLAKNLENKINKDFGESYGDRLLNRSDRSKSKVKNKNIDKTQSKLPF